MWDALIAAVAAALTTRVSNDVGEAAQSAWTALFRKVRRRLGAKAGAIDTGDQAALERALQQAVEDDPVFPARLQSLLRQASEERGGRADLEIAVPSPAVFAPTVARQLPAGPADFVNRVADLAVLDEIGGGEPGSTPVVVLRGPPGVGKQALALRWGHHHRDWFGGGQLYADLREPSDAALGGPELADDALTSFLGAMGVPSGLMPASFAARRSLYQTLSAQEPVLVLLHGASEPAQITPLIPTAPGSVLVVSTQHDVGGLAMDGARFVEVEPFDEDAALALLVAVCGAERIDVDRAAAMRLVDLCGRLPVALRVSAARLQLDPTLSVAALVEEMATQPYLLDAMTLPGGDGGVESLFTGAYQGVSVDAQRLYRDIGALPVAEVTDEMLAAVGWPDRAVRRAAVDALLGIRLLERLDGHRYTQHPLIRSHAAALANELGQGRAERVVIDAIEHVCEFAELADLAIMGSRRRLAAEPVRRDTPFSGDHARADALRALEQMRADLLRVARTAAAIGADRQVTRLAEAVTAGLYFNHRHLADWIEMSRLAIMAAQRLARYNIEAQVHCTLSRAYTDAGDRERARVEIEAALALLPAANDPIVAGTVWEFYGRHLDLVARAAPASDQPAARAEAEAAFRTAIDLYVEHGVARGAALGRFYLGVFLDATGRPVEALPLLELARQGFNAADDDRNAARADAAIGAAHLHLGHYRQAYDELSVAAAYLATAQLWHYEAGVRDNLALAATALGDPAAAEHSRRAADIRRLSAAGQ